MAPSPGETSTHKKLISGHTSVGIITLADPDIVIEEFIGNPDVKSVSLRRTIYWPTVTSVALFLLELLCVDLKSRFILKLCLGTLTFNMSKYRSLLDNVIVISMGSKYPLINRIGVKRKSLTDSTAAEKKVNPLQIYPCTYHAFLQ